MAFFDESGPDQSFGHTFETLPDLISGARLRIRIVGDASGTVSNDTLPLETTGAAPPFSWSIPLRSLVPSWDVGAQETLVLNLAALPLASGPRTTNILAFLNDDHALDVYISDDTGVDFIELDAIYCPDAGTREEDCNTNGIPDRCDILNGTSEDVNLNGIPDECEGICDPVTDPGCADCNSNLVFDVDIASDFSFDCNGDDVPDECQPDCNDNSILDKCDILSGVSADCNSMTCPMSASRLRIYS